MGEKIFINGDTTQYLSTDLANTVFEDGFKPNVIMPLLRGGAGIANIVHEFLLRHLDLLEIEYIAAQGNRYDNGRAGYGNSKKVFKLDNLDEILFQTTEDDLILLVDDVHDEGLSSQGAIIQYLLAMERINSPEYTQQFREKMATGEFKKPRDIQKLYREMIDELSQTPPDHDKFIREFLHQHYPDYQEGQKVTIGEFTRLYRDVNGGLTPEIRFASLHEKPTKSKTLLRPDYCLIETAEWIVYEHEAPKDGLTLEEIRSGKPEQVAAFYKL